MNEQDARFDCAIVGGGILGAMSLYYAQQEMPESRVVLFEQHFFASGSTARSGGLMPIYGSSPECLGLARESRAEYEQLRASVSEFPAGPQPAYWILPSACMRDLEVELGQSLYRLESAPGELVDAYPGLQVPPGHVVAFDNTLWVADASSVANRMIESAITKSGGRIETLEGVRVEQIKGKDGGVVLQRSDGFETFAKRAIIATGPWIYSCVVPEDIRGAHIKTKRTVCLHFKAEQRKNTPVVIFYSEKAFLLPIPERNRTLFNFTSEVWDYPPDSHDMQVNEEDINAATGILRKYIPGMIDRYTGGQVFCDGYTANRAPLVTKLTYLPECVIVSGASGAGVRLGPATAKRALKLLMCDESK